MGGGKQIPSATSPKVRDSQMELLRIVAMSMILIHHFVVHASGYNIIKQGLGLQNAFVYYGVDIRKTKPSIGLLPREESRSMPVW